MADSQSVTDDIFSVDRIRSLIELMKEHGLSEIDLRQDTQQIRLARATLAPPGAAVPVLAAQAMQPPAAIPGNELGQADSNPHIITVTAPMVGTFYTRPNPNAKNFVEVGATIQPDSVICIIEAMKVFNEIPAEVRGKVVSILVQNEEAVDYGKPLFKVDTRG